MTPHMFLSSFLFKEHAPKSFNILIRTLIIVHYNSNCSTYLDMLQNKNAQRANQTIWILDNPLSLYDVTDIATCIFTGCHASFNQSNIHSIKPHK